MMATRPRDIPRDATGAGEAVVTDPGYRVCIALLSESGGLDLLV
jgi:hypothetical protein